MKFLIVPEYFRAYDFRMGRELGQALVECGHAFDIMPSHGQGVKEISANGYDAVLGINRPRPDDLAPYIIFISWVQDYRPIHPIDYAGLAGSNDLIYTIGSADWLGFTNPGPCYRGSLLMGVEQELLDRSPAKPELDFSICGYIPIPFTKIELGKFDRLCFKEAERLYHPLTGSLRAITLVDGLKKFLEDLIANGQVAEKDREDSLKNCEWLSIEYPRYIDRLRMAQMAYSVSSKCGFYGVNWPKYYQFGKCTGPHITDEKKLQGIYQRTKVNLHCNWNGFGLHHRVLEVMALGGFIMAHSCADPQADGRITTDFEPDVHFGEYTPDNFMDRARYWLENDGARGKAATEARKIIAAKHLWKHRAQQILKDLN